jgi:polar amino acid transport system substrate-binding protein
MRSLVQRFLVILAIFVLPVVLAAGCGSSNSNEGGGTSAGATTTGASGAQIQPPSDIADAGKLIFCSDITYPPEEFYKGTTPTGSDIDIGNEIARRMGVTGQFDNTGFDGIIAALLSNKCDAIISGMNDTPERAKTVDFVDYISVGQSLMVQKDNPKSISSLQDLGGKSVSVEVGTTNKDFLEEASKKLPQKIDVVAFPKDTDAANALKTGKVDAYFGDSPVVAYYIAQDPSSFAFGGSPINPIPVGIALKKDNSDLKDAISKAVDAMYADGTMNKILAKWQMSDFALKNQ